MPSAFDKAKLLAGSSNRDDPGISFPAFPSIANLKVHTSLILTLVKKFIPDSNSSRALGGSEEMRA